MAVSPTSGPPVSLSASRSSTRSSDPAQAAEKETNRRIAEAHARTQEAERQARQALDDLRDEYTRQYEKQAERNSTSIEATKNNGYEQIQKIKRDQQVELNRVKREGERELAAIKKHYDTSIYRTERDGHQQFEEAVLNGTTALEQQARQNQANYEFAATEHSRRMLGVQNERNESIARLSESSRQDIEKFREQSGAEKLASERKFIERAEQARGAYDEILGRIHTEAKADLDQLRLNTSRKLSAYSERQEDPFYQLLDLDTDLYENSDGYVLKASIPEHEQGGVSVSIRNNELVLTGQRRNEEKSETEDGGRISTSSYQTFSKSFPLGFPVEAKELKRSYEDGVLTVFVPKKNTYSPQQVYKAKKVARAKIERPQFPDNLPLAKHSEPTESPDPPRSKPRLGSRTLG